MYKVKKRFLIRLVEYGTIANFTNVGLLCLLGRNTSLGATFLHWLAHLNFGPLEVEGSPSTVLTQLSLCPLPQVELPAFCFSLLCPLHVKCT